jgi:DNA-directed RNA polymerase subunit RPC12/RpoP
MTNQINGLRQYVCASCGGTVLTVAVLRQLVGSLASQVWTEPPSSAPDDRQARCPFCSQPMQPKALASGYAGCAAICRACETVWLDNQAVHSLPDKAASREPTLASQSLKCPQCGAPIANSWEEKCQFCGAAIHAPVQVVVLPTSLPGEAEQDQGPWPFPHRKSLYSSVLKRMIDGRG